MTDKFQYDVFLSHNSKDKPRVRTLAEKLKQAGLRVWFDEWIVRPGDDIYLAIERGIEVSRALILCMSPAAFAADWVTLERSAVLFRDPSNKHRRFIPLLLRNCEIPDTLRRYKYIDYRKPTRTTLTQLLKICEPPPTPVRKPTATPMEAPMELRAVLEETIKTPLNWVSDLAISPNGRWLAAGEMGDDLWVGDLESGLSRGRLKGHTDWAIAVCIMPDGNHIVSGSDDCTLRVWDARTLREVMQLNGHTERIRDIVALSDGKRVLSSSWDKTLRLWDIVSGKCINVLTGSDDIIASLDVAHTDDLVISGQGNGKIRVWSLITGKCQMVLTGHEGTVNSVKIMPDRVYAVSGSNDKTLKIWDLRAGACTGTLEGHASDVLSIDLSPDGALIASAGFTDHTVRLWDWKSGVCLQVLDLGQSPVSVAFNATGTGLVVGTADSYIYRYRFTDRVTSPPAEAPRRYMNAKVVLVGESGVGKSGLAHRLIEDQFVKTDSTHGMHVWPLALPLKEEDAFEREALLWDLAGQEDYRIIHQLFLDETALALVLFNPQKDDPFADLGDWLKALKAAVSAKDPRREVAKLLIAARVDRGTTKVSQRKIDRVLKEHGFLDYLATSAETGNNCSDALGSAEASALKQLIARNIPWDKLPWTSTPRLLAELKSAVIEMKEEKKIRLLRFSELFQRLETKLIGEAFGEADARTAVTLLANHGLAIPLKFGDLVLLRPELINGYAAAVIRAARAHIDEIGCVREDDIYGEAFDFQGVDRLPRPDEELLLRAMVQTFLEKSLCIAEDTPAGRQLIFPSHYRRERPIPSHPEIFVSYTFSGEPQTVYTTLVVRLWYSREFDQKELWGNAAEFVTSKERTLGLMMERAGEGRAKISVFFETGIPDELKVVFIEFVHQHLEKYAREVERDRRYVCECGKPVTDFDTVRERLAAGKRFILCQKCDRKVLLIDHIEQRLATDPVAQKVLSMDQKATRELDTQALEQILIGHMMAICGEANQIYRPVSMFDYGIDGEIEFRDKDGNPSGRKIYVQLKSGASYLRTRKSDATEIFDVKNDRHLEYWVTQPVHVYLVIRDAEGIIRWMDVTRYLKRRKDKASRQIVFDGLKLDAPAVWRVRDEYFPAVHKRSSLGSATQ